MSVQHVQSPLTRAGQSGAASPWLVRFFLALVLGGVFVYAGALKAWDPVKFASDIQNFHILSWRLGVRLAFYLPWLEIVCGLALLTGWLRTGAVGILSALMMLFIAVTIAARVRGIDLDCGCFGSATKNLPFRWHLVIDFALLVALLVLWSPVGRLSVRVRYFWLTY